MSLEDTIKLNPPASHIDARRSIIDVFRGDIQIDLIKSIHAVGNIIVSSSNLPLGNHYHTRKDELFHLPAGQGVARFYRLDTQETVTIPLNASNPDSTYLWVPRGVAHTFWLEPKSVLTHIAVNMEPGYNPTDPVDNLSCVLSYPI